MRIKLAYMFGCIIIANPIFANIPSFVGDLLGRDLQGAGPLGHVGVATAPDYRMRPTTVLEALMEAPHIQENTIENFKSRTKYWGSKGGLLTPKSIESYIVANRIVRQYYACPEYTITWRWKEGKIDSNNQALSCGQFRCDTLVNYAYAFSQSYSLPTYNTTWTTPLAIFNYFPTNSDLFLPNRSINYSTADSNKIFDNMNSINENNLNELNEKNFYQLLQATNDISKEQITHLWKLFTSNEIDNKVKLLFYDFISFENPNYLTEEIINQAKKENGELRHKLLVALQSIYQKNFEQKAKLDLHAIIEYFNELQFQDLDKNDMGIVHRGLATLAPKFLQSKKSNLTNMDKIHVNILSIRTDRNNEIKYVKDIIHSLNHPDDNLLVTASYQYFTQLLINSDLKFFSNESKELFKRHLDKISMVNSNQTMLYTSAYIEFKAALHASTLEEFSALTYHYVQSLEPSIQEATVYGFTDFIKNSIIH